MARTIKVYANPGYTTPTLRLIDDADSIGEVVALTEGTNGTGIYTGTLSSAGAGTWDGVLLDDTTPKGVFGYIRILGVDPEVVKVGDAHGVPDGIKLEAEIVRNNVSGDSLTETLSET